MFRRLRLCAAGGALAVTCSLGIAASSASAYVTSDISNITLTGSFATIGTTYTTSSDPSQDPQFKWLDAAGKATTIAAMNCSTFGEYGRVNFPAGDTSYGTLYPAGTGSCFFLRGRTQAGEGPMANPHDGRVKR
jgi:hypothetical protein